MDINELNALKSQADCLDCVISASLRHVDGGDSEQFYTRIYDADVAFEISQMADFMIRTVERAQRYALTVDENRFDDLLESRNTIAMLNEKYTI